MHDPISAWSKLKERNFKIRLEGEVLVKAEQETDQLEVSLEIDKGRRSQSAADPPVPSSSSRVISQVVDQEEEISAEDHPEVGVDSEVALLQEEAETAVDSEKEAVEAAETVEDLSQEEVAEVAAAEVEVEEVEVAVAAAVGEVVVVAEVEDDLLPFYFIISHLIKNHKEQ